MRGAHAAIAWLFFVAVACGSTVDVIEVQTDDGGAPGDASNDVNALGDASPNGDAQAGEIVFVSVSGNDANDGLTPGTPKRSISAGITTARARPGSGVEVHVCRGSYAETGLVLSDPIALRGGYDCTTWQRASGFAAPTYDGVIQTVITNATGAATQNDTLTIDGVLADSSALIEGFSIVATGGTAVHIDHGASPRLTNDRIHGESTATLGVFGVEILGASSPELSFNAIDAVCAQIVATTGLALYSGSPHIHDNAITAGPSLCGAHAVSLASGAPQYLYGDGVMTEASGNAFENNTVIGGGEGLGILGPIIVDVVNNDIRATGDSLYDATSRGIGALIFAQGRLRVLRNRIYGGHALESIGAEISGPSVVIADNMIHGGVSSSSSSTTLGLLLHDAPDVVVTSNTLYDGAASDPTLLHADVLFYGAAGTVRPANFSNNIFAGSGGSDVAIMDNGAPTEIATFSNNVVLNQGVGVYALRGCGSGPCFGGLFQVTTTISDTEAAFQSGNPDAGISGGTAMNNVALTSACPDAGTCLATLTSLFASFSAPPDDGFSNLVGSGFLLKPAAPCSVARGGTPTFIATDLFGTARSSTSPSIGADEFVGVCAP